MLLLVGGVFPATSVHSAEDRNGGSYVVQLNAFKKQENARSFGQKLMQKGYPVYVAHQGGERFYKVRLGPFSTWDAARKAARDLKRWEKLSPLVLWTATTDAATETPPAAGVLASHSPESSGPPEKSGVKSASETSPPAPSDPRPEEVDQVVARFLAWKSAWQSGNVKSYLSFYSPSFDARPKSWNAWKRSRARALARNVQIEIEVTEIQIVPEADRVEMSFIQKYRSREVDDVGHKTLVWRWEQGSWKIVSEQWLPI